MCKSENLLWTLFIYTNSFSNASSEETGFFAHCKSSIEFFPTLVGKSKDFFWFSKIGRLEGRGGFWLEAYGIQIHVGAEDGVDRLTTKAHLAYEVSDLEIMRARLKQIGLEILEGPTILGLERFETRDPFGNRIEFLRRLY